MFKPILSHLFPGDVYGKLRDRNQLFHRTRWRLAVWYAGMMGAVLIICGLGVYEALIYAYRLTIAQELDLVANELHETLEPILEQPGKLAPASARILPDLCLVNTPCLKNEREAKQSSLQYRKYYIHLFDLDGNLVGTVGKQTKDLNDFKGNDLERVSVELETKDFQPWGFVEIGHTSSEYAIYITYLSWISIVGLLVSIIVLIFISWWLAGRAMQPVRQSYRLLQQFTADAAHELRTPLAVIRATVESTLMMPAISETETQETLKTIGRQNVRLSNLVADLLMLCRMDRQLNASHSSINSAIKIVERVSLNNLIEDIVEDFGSLAIKSEIQLKIESAISKPLTIQGSYEQLYRMISNLVANALQYTTPGGEIRLVLNRSGKYSTIAVEDTGIGISESELNKIFTRFYRVDGDRSRDTGGSGLGLSIAMAIAKAHQGNIKVESQPGRGSKFTIFLPSRSN